MSSLERVERRETLLREVVVANPSAGVEWTVSVPSGSLWIPQAVYGELQASAVAGTRLPSLVFSNGEQVWARVISAAGVAVGAFGRFSWLREYGDHFNIAADPTRNQSLPRLLLRPGTVVSSLTVSKDVGDQWSNVVVSVVEVIEHTPQVAAAFERAMYAGKRSDAIPLVDPAW